MMHIKKSLTSLQNKPVLLIGVFLSLACLIWLLSWLPTTSSKFSIFSTVFLGIFVEAFPFLLLGTIASGLVEVYIDSQFIQRVMPGSPILSAFVGSFMGLFFPVCECGVVPLVRRLFSKGFPVPAGIAFLLSAPVINPIVILSTATAFGFGKMLLMRIVFTLLIAILTALVFAFGGASNEILLAQESTPADSCCLPDHDHDHHHDPAELSSTDKLKKVFQITLEEFFEIGRYLVLGGLIAASLQTFVPQSILIAVGKGPLLSILVMLLLAVILSVCSTVDSFVALGFIGIFNTPAVLAFLLYGPMVDIKSTLMFFRVFRPRVVIYLITIPLLLVLLVTVSLNTFWVW
jgi:uncharacterized protein